MGQYQNQRESRSELQQRIAAELKAKAEQQSKNESDQPDGVTDSRYIQGTKQTTSLAWAWLLIFLAAIGVFVYVAVKTNQ